MWIELKESKGILFADWMNLFLACRGIVGVRPLRRGQHRLSSILVVRHIEKKSHREARLMAVIEFENLGRTKSEPQRSTLAGVPE